MGTPDRVPAAEVGRLAAAVGQVFPLKVCRSRAGYYLGTRDVAGLPFSRESVEYWPTAAAAEAARAAGMWTQRLTP